MPERCKCGAFLWFGLVSTAVLIRGKQRTAARPAKRCYTCGYHWVQSYTEFCAERGFDRVF